MTLWGGEGGGRGREGGGREGERGRREREREGEEGRGKEAGEKREGGREKGNHSLSLLLFETQTHDILSTNRHCTWDISMQGSLPTLAPVKPYTELALSFSASC